MKPENILDSMGMIDSRFVEEADSPTPKIKRKPSVLKLSLVAVIITLCMALIVPTFATYVAHPDEFLYAVFPSIAQKLKPVQMSCTDNGIKLEVISANVTDSEAQVYVSLQDLEGDRVDETTDLFDSYDIRRPFDSTATCSMIRFDEETGIATFLIQIEWNNTRKVMGSKVTFSLREFLSHKQKHEGYLDSIALSEVRDAEETVTNVEIRGASYLDEEQELLTENSEYLKPCDKGVVEYPTDGVKITGIGYIDGKLHIQMYLENIKDFDNHGWISVVDENGIENVGEQSVSFWDDTETGSYEELVYDISPEELKDCRLRYSFVTTDTITRGDWEVTFELN